MNPKATQDPEITPENKKALNDAIDLLRAHFRSVIIILQIKPHYSAETGMGAYSCSFYDKDLTDAEKLGMLEAVLLRARESFMRIHST